ncbi:hypothetical protein [Sporomusa sphaeroides]|nr:hypothetical protein [Sporomusa sphaeroides]
MNYMVKDDEPQCGVFLEHLMPKINAEIDRIIDMRQQDKTDNAAE